jgi:hypothetical protein
MASAALALLPTTQAQFSYTTAGSAYTQNFNGLGTANITAAGGNLGAVVTAVNGWYFLETGTGANTTMTVGTGISGTADTYHFGPVSNTERSLGGLQSGSVVPVIGFYLTNNTGVTLNQVAIAYTGETWRIGAAGRADKLDFQYSTDATALNNGTWTNFDALDYANSAAAATANGSMLQSAGISGTITGLNIPNGGTLFIRWNDFNASGSDDGLSVDDFSLTATASPVITVNQAGFNGAFGNVVVGNSSASSSFTVSASNLTNDLIITPPAGGFEIRTGVAAFATAPINLGAGNVATITIDVRFTPAGAGAQSGDVSVASTGATGGALIPVSGTGVAASAPTQLVVTAINGGNPVIQNSPFSIAVQAQDAGNVPQNVATNTTVQISLITGFGTLGGTLSGTITAGTSTVTISGLTYDLADLGVVLEAAATAGDVLTSGQSAPFDVLGQASTLGFTNVPFSGLVNTNLATFQVQVLRDDFTVATEFTGPVTLSVSTGPGLITGTLTQNAVGGVVTFSNIQLSAAGSYILEATSVGLTSGFSTSIAITNVASMTELIFPQFAVNGSTTGTRLPYVCRLQLNDLVPNATYRYFTGASDNPALGTGVPAGNFFVINNTSDAAGYIVGQSSAKSMAGVLMGGDEFVTFNRFGEFTADGSGSYTGWFSFVPTGNAAFAEGNNVYFYVSLNNGTGGTTVASSVRSTSTIAMIATTGSARAAYGNSSASSENMVFLYDNTAGTGRPLWGTWTENDGIDQTYTTWYDAGVDGQSGRWAAYLPTTLPNGVRRIEQRSVVNGTLVNCPGLSANGTWTGAGNTVNPTAGVTPIVFTTGDANFNAPTLWYADTDGDGLGDATITQTACTQPSGFVAVAGDACPAVSGTVGSPCNDGNPATINDVLQGDCSCLGQNVDCLGVPGGTALPGTPCDDLNANTGNDTWDNSCNCVGQQIDCLGVPGGAALPGSTCDDGNPATGNDTWNNACACVGQLIDCLGVPGGSALPNTPCSDGNPATINDAWNNACACVGTPVTYGVGNVVVLQVGNGTGSLANTGNPIVLREFTPTGTNTFDLAIPSSGADPLVLGGTSTSEGLLSRSSNRRELVFAGYAQVLPGASSLSSSTSATVNRAVGTVNASAVFTREAVSSTFFSGGNPRAAGGDGTNYWGAGSNTGVVYYGPGDPAIVSTTLTNNRSTEVYNGQLYFSTGSGATRGIWAVGTGLPTGTGTASTNVINTGGSSSPYEFVFNAAGTTCYIADDRTVATGGGIQRWDLVGGVWTLSYTLGTGTNGARGLDVDFSQVTPVVYAITADSPARLVKFSDTGAASALVTLATAATNTAFRGVALAPQDCDPPVVNVTTNSPICAGEVLNLSATATGVAPLSYAWFGPSGTFSPNAASITVTGASTGTIFVTVSSGCGSTTVPVNVVVNPAPTAATVDGAQTICVAGTTASLGGNTPTVGTGAWSIVSGGTGTFSNASAGNSTFTHTGGAGPVVLRWTITSNAPCPSSSADVSVNVNEPPTTATVGGAQTICPNTATLDLGGNTPTVGTGTWSIVSGGTGTFSDASAGNSTFTHTGGAGPIVLRWTITSLAPCAPSTADVTVTLNTTDTDGDGVIDCVDNCPNLFGQIGQACNAGPGFVIGTINSNCECIGQVCTTNLVLDFQTDANPQQISWELRGQGTNILAQSGSGLPAPNAFISVNTCLPNGCYYLRVLDSGGDGILNGGGYILRTAGNPGQRIIDNRNNFTTGSVSAVIGNGGFCLPLGTDRLIFTSCDKLDWVNNQFIVAAENPAVSAQWQVGNQTDDGYQFWWFDPNGTYGYIKFRSHATSDGFGTGATRACHARINNWSPNQIPANVLMNVKVRGRVNGSNLPWGPVCRFKIDPVRAACPLTKLMDIPGNANFSCGVIRAWGSGAANKVVARPVEGATQYQFRWTNGEIPNGVVRTTTTPLLQLNWTPALPNGTYQVQVRAFKNGAWCVTSLPWGDVCNVTITGSPNAMLLDGGNGQDADAMSVTASVAKLFPNPNNGEQLTVSLSAVEAGVGTVAVDIFDLNGARVSAQVIAVNDGMVYQVVDVAGLADGLYMVNITAGSQRYTERLVIAK